MIVFTTSFTSRAGSLGLVQLGPDAALLARPGASRALGGPRGVA